MGGDDERLSPLVELIQHLHDLLRAGRIEIGGGLIQDHNLGLHGQDAGNGHPLLLPATQMVGRTALISGEAHILQSKAHVLFDLLGWISQIGRPEGDVLVNRRRKELVVRVLEDHAHCPAHLPQAGGIVLQRLAGK